MKEKAYKLLALQEKISNNAAKELIDNGLVSIKGEKLTLARSLVSLKSKFELKKQKKTKIIFEDEKIIALNKAENTVMQDIEKEFKAKALNRLDKQTSGVVLLCKDDDFREKCINEFKHKRVKKIYIAILNGIIFEELEINEPLLVYKNKGQAFSKINKRGLEAKSIITPLLVSNKKSLVKINITTGRTHQIRAHSAFIGHGILGDEKYAHSKAARMYLHSLYLEFLNFRFYAPLDDSFKVFNFDIKNLKF